MPPTPPPRLLLRGAGRRIRHTGLRLARRLRGPRQALGRSLAWLERRRPALPGGTRLWVTLISFGFLLAALQSHGRGLLRQNLDPQGWWWLCLGLGLSLLSLVVNALGWGVILRWLGLRPEVEATALLYLGTNLRKYLPGGIWHLAARVRALQAPEAPLAEPATTGQALLAVLLDPLLAAIAALALVAPADLQEGSWGRALLWLLPLLLLLPRWLTPLLLRLERQRARQLARPGEEPALVMPPARVPLLPLLALLLFVLLRFSGFASCVLAFDLQGSLEWSRWLAGFALAWTVGLVVPGAPGGLGVFEAMLLLSLGGLVPEGPLLAVALSYRVVATAADLLAAGTAAADRRWLGIGTGCRSV
ncbi:MAG: lysylphosphatidylglycerol synthase domain-containing protein [Synechococcus sp.]|nr:lysylphosphatidylglycerol synthase domain-containing protein [Synechococcus sp.]